MEELIQVIPIVILIVITLLGAMRRQNRQQPDPDGELEEEDGVFLPPWGNLEPLEEEIQPAPPVQTEEPPPTPQETLSHDEVPADEPEIHPSEVDSAAGAHVPQVDTIAGISLSSQTVRQGIILSEILGRPKSLRRPPS